MVFLFIVTLSQHIQTIATLVSHSHNHSSWFYLIIVTSRNSLPNCEPKVFYKKAGLKDLAILIGKHLSWSLFLINLQPYKPAIYYNETATRVFSCEYCESFKNIFFKGYLSTTASELYLFKVEEIMEKLETYSETIIGQVLRTQWNI